MTLILGQVFDCLGKCQCYPEYKIIQCPTGLRNQLGLTSKANIDGFQVNDNQKVNFNNFITFSGRNTPNGLASRHTAGEGQSFHTFKI